MCVIDILMFLVFLVCIFVFFFKQKTAYEMRISDWSSDVCSSDLADLVRAVVQDFRDIVSRTQQDACTLLEALAQMREETEQRLDVVDSLLDWQQAGDLPDPPLDEAQVLHLFRIAREAVTNALRHGRARHIRVRVLAVAAHLLLDFTDDGPGQIGRTSCRERVCQYG